jgi:hypothetical protein
MPIQKVFINRITTQIDWAIELACTCMIHNGSGVLKSCINYLVNNKHICIILSMDQKVLFAWIGRTDLKAQSGELGEGLGPIGQAVTVRAFTHIVLLSNYKKTDERRYIEWLHI